MYISGVKVLFPEGKQPFPQQIGVMQKVISSATHRQNALLESPTGTGKTLSLLCSSLSWQRKQYELDYAAYQAAAQEASAKLAASSTTTTTASHGQEPPPAKKSRHFNAGSVPGDSKAAAAADDEEEDDLFEDDNAPPPLPVAAAVPMPSAATTTTTTTTPPPPPPPTPPKPVKIFYSSRTHTQLTQVVAELKRCPQDLLAGPGGAGGGGHGNGLRITVLGSREQYCVNPKVFKDKQANKNDACKALLKESKCPYFAASKLLARQISSQIMDVEDLVTKGKKDIGCPFFASKWSIPNAHIIFLPYNYLMDPSIRSGGDLAEHIKGALVIFDEAHNVEDVSRDSASIEMSLEVIRVANLQLDIIAKESLELSKACYDLSKFLGGLATWAHDRPAPATSDNGLRADTQVVLEGPEAIASIEAQQDISITPASLAEYRACLELLKSKDDKEGEDGGGEDASAASSSSSSNRGGRRKALTTLPNGTVGQIDSLLHCLDFLVSDGMRYARDFRVAMTTKWQPGGGGGGGGRQLAYRDGGSGKADMFLCIWCLNPAVAFRALAESTRSLILTSGTLSPLRAFAAELGVEFKHTLEANHVCDINKQLVALAVLRMRNELLDCTFKNAERLDFQSAIGEAVLLVSRATPGGVLVFFPSYAMLDRCSNRWRQTGLWDALAKIKPICSETKGGSEEFDRAVAQYRALCTPGNGGNGGVFFAVFRGKLSEGIDFRDDQARAVLIVGIPFPNTRDLVVGLKKQHQDAARRRSLTMPSPPGQPLSGNEWYEQQAYRALNQALGRVIRHRNDYGAIVLLDQRFREQRVVDQLSKWMRGAVRVTQELNDTAPAQLADFFHRLSVQQQQQPQQVLQPQQQPQQVLQPLPPLTPIATAASQATYSSSFSTASAYYSSGSPPATQQKRPAYSQQQQQSYATPALPSRLTLLPTSAAVQADRRNAIARSFVDLTSHDDDEEEEYEDAGL